jgi:hypothetical protein
MVRFIVRRIGNFWQINREGDYTVVASSDTQQNAIDIAKSMAQEERGQVEWWDREGFRQGEVDYSTVFSRKRDRGNNAK